MEQLLQEMKAVQEKTKFERYSFEQKLKEMKFEFNKRSFTYDCLKIRENKFFLLCGLNVNEFLFSVCVSDTFFTSDCVS